MSWQKPGTFSPIIIYSAIACGGYAVDLACYILLVKLGSDLYLAYISGFLIGATANVALLRRYFAEARFQFLRDVGMTIVSNGMVIALGIAIYAALMHLLGVQHLVAKIMSNVLTFGLNYFTRRLYF